MLLKACQWNDLKLHCQIMSGLRRHLWHPSEYKGKKRRAGSIPKDNPSSLFYTIDILLFLHYIGYHLFPLFVHGQKWSIKREVALYPNSFMVMHQLGNNELELGSNLGKGPDCTPIQSIMICSVQWSLVLPKSHTLGCHGSMWVSMHS